ncbi:hypothetical protein C8R47DRAFT_1134537 [Mycena vitilis]|nr:hypothetical protein C8R47DRAFT_1134537 [Mycena vitilis]
MMKATVYLLFTALLVNAFPTPDLPAPTLLAAQLDSDCANNACPIVSLSILGSARPRMLLTVSRLVWIPKTHSWSKTPVQPKP